MVFYLLWKVELGFAWAFVRMKELETFRAKYKKIFVKYEK